MENQQLFIGQTYLTINVDVQASINGVADAKLKYRKPSGVVGDVALTVVDANLGLLKWESPLDSSLFDIAGHWTFWADLTFNNGGKILGSPDSLTVSKAGRGV